MNILYRHNSVGRNNAIFIILIVFCLSMYSIGASLTMIFNLAFIGLIILIMIKPIFSVLKIVVSLFRKLRTKRSVNLVQNIDNLNWYEFELYVAKWLKAQGYINVCLTEKYDLGVDIIAEKDDVRWGVQVKHSKNIIKIEAVREVVAALKVYGCERAMVVTNSLFTDQAKTLAKSNNCVLVDGRLIKKEEFSKI